MSLTSLYRPPYDWEAMLAFLRPAPSPASKRVASGRYRRTHRLRRAGAAWCRVAPAATRSPRSHRPLSRSDRAADDHRPRCGACSTWPPTRRRSAQHLRSDPALAPLVAARPGLRVPGAWDGFELAVRAILGQQITVAAATGSPASWSRAYGEPLPRGLARRAGLTHVFPDARSGSPAPTSPRSACPQRARRSLGALAAAVAADPRLFGPRAGLEDGGRRACARSPGIGEWTAQYIAMRELREPDAFPAADIGLMRAHGRRDGERPTPAALLARAERWRPWRAYAALHLWTSDARFHHLPRGAA